MAPVRQFTIPRAARILIVLRIYKSLASQNLAVAAILEQAMPADTPPWCVNTAGLLIAQTVESTTNCHPDQR